ncbi:drug resistance transporter, EmrB/QacA subfamily [Amycolatopsis arida]|uniref:Drug resistance transporter, EmrB/QacA subfamily n=1 Tax=Amycolatopsis arida TaxID=587909 RepID=A0A1I6A8N9_9PSEU|nr:MFS transporter [Amycolatopsis arida]TDX88513.1 EmrB/QacA subfamily drug resistance transporter [Amycolatopsis arida]SFQ65071.1 drug resistance transporter, EmrB/QacA subfamily [Amycolatopsis arida]
MTEVAGAAARGGHVGGDQRERVPRRAWGALAAVLLACFLHQFDLTVISVAVPSLQADLAASPSSVQWLVAGYTLTFAVLLVPAGRLGDAVGRRVLVIAGVVGFTLASLACALAPNEGVLVAARVAQGGSAALLAPQVMPVVMLMFPAARRGAAMGAFAASVALATTSGPLLGGLLVGADLFGLGWRAIFVVNVPVGAAALVLALACLPRAENTGRAADPALNGWRRARIDVFSVALALVGLLLLIAPLVQGRELGWPWWAIVLPVASVPVLAALVPAQRRTLRAGGLPLIAPELFQQRAYLAGAAVNFLVVGGVTAFFLVFVVYLQVPLGRSPAATGLTVAPWALASAVASAAAIPLAGRFGRRMLETGAVLMVAGMVLLLGFVVAQGTALDTAAVVVSLVIVGVGMGMLSPPLYSITLMSMSRQDIGSASGVFSAVGQAGGAFGVATGGTIFYGVVAGGGPDVAPGGWTAAIGWALVHQVVVYVVAVVVLRRCLPAAGSSGPPRAPEPGRSP